MGFQSSIFIRKDYAHALSALDITTEILDFPVTARCPICSELSLNIYENIPRSDLWMACSNCSAHGNIITFAGAYWKISELDAIDKFKKLGVNTRELSGENLNEVHRHARIIDAADKFWAQAKDQLWSLCDDLLTLKFRDFGLSPEIPCQGLAGVVNTDQVAELCKTVRPAYPRKLRKDVPVFVLPFCDLPRHYTGFLLTQYLNDFEVRRVFVANYLPKNTNNTDFGYYMLEQAVLAPGHTVKNSLFVVDDPLWVLRAQTVQLKHGNDFLPLCASYSGKEGQTMGSTWSGVSQKRKFFYSRRITPELISQAANAPGYVCAIKKDGLEPPKQPQKTIKTLGQLFRAAVTWQKTLAHVFETRDDLAANSFFTKLDVPIDKLRMFLTNHSVVLPEVAEDLLTKVTPRHFTSTEATDYTTSVVAREDGWYSGKNILITNCLPVIEKIIYTDTKKYYVGHIKKQKKIVPFCENARKVDFLGLLAYAERVMAAHGEHVIFVSYWNRRGHITAMALRPPEIIHMRDKPGWDETTKEFYTADYAINTAGVVRPMPYTDLKINTSFKLPEPGLFPPTTIQNLLGPAPEISTIWLIISTILANMLAPTLDKELQSTAVVDSLFLTTKQIFKTMNLDCREVKTTAARMVKNFLTQLSSADWPQVIFSYHISDKPIEMAVARCQNTAAAIKISTGTVTAALSYGWQVITGVLPSPNLDYSAVPYIIAGYLQSALSQRGRLLRPENKNLTIAVLRDLHEWAEKTYANSFNLAQAEKNLLLPGEEPIYLMREINNAILDNKIDVLPAPRTKRQNWNYLIRDNQTWWLNQRAIDNYFKTIGAIKPNWLAIAECFARADVLCGEKVINQMTGLLVKKEWCDTFWENYNDAKIVDAG